MSLEIPKLVLEHRLAHDAAGEIWLARRVANGRQVELKLLALDANQKEMRAQFLHEAQALANLDHPNVVRIHEHGLVDDHAYIAMEYVAGDTLLERMRHAPMRLAEAIDIVVQLAGALAAVHCAGLTHRDLRPTNVILRDAYTPVLSHFGSAGRTAQNTIYGPKAGFIGSPGYLSPEQIDGHPASASGDLYALGLIFHELLTGAPAHPGPSTEAVCAQRRQLPPPILPAPLAILQPVLERLLARDPADRFERAEALIDQLRHALPTRAALRSQESLGASTRGRPRQMPVPGFEGDPGERATTREAQGATPQRSQSIRGSMQFAPVPRIAPGSGSRLGRRIRSFTAALSCGVLTWVMRAR